MIKKLSISILLTLLLVGNAYPVAAAKSPNVKDCIENDEDCVEQQSGDLNGEQNKEEDDSRSSPSLFLSFVKMIAALLLVLTLIYLLLKMLKSRNTLHKQKSLQNLGGISVGSNKSIQLIRVGSTYYLIGVGDNVDMLTEITDQNLIEEMMDEAEKNDDNPFDKFMSSFTKKKTNSSGENKKDFKKLFSNELANLQENRQKLREQQIRKDNDE